MATMLVKLWIYHLFFPFLSFAPLGIQSPDQQSLLADHNPDRPIFVEGPFRLWLKKTCVYYYILRAKLLPPEERVNDVAVQFRGADAIGGKRLSQDVQNHIHWLCAFQWRRSFL